MSQNPNAAIAIVGIDIGKNSFHVVGLDQRGAIVLRQKWSRGQVEARFANMLPCLIGMEACVGAHHLSRRLKALGHDTRLMSVPGIGPIISSAMVAAIGSGEVFTKGRDFAAWLGLVPRQMSTGGRTILGRISKRGNRYLRVLFVQAAWVVLIKPKSWERHGLKSWIEAAKKRLHPNVLAIALANKLARIAWGVLAHGRDFEARTNTNATAQAA